MSDASFASVSVLALMNGTNGSTTFTDSGPLGVALTPAGNAQLSTSNVKYGSACGLFDGTGDYVTSATNAAFSLDNGTWTIDAWLRTSQTTRADIIGQDSHYNNQGWYGITLNVASSGQIVVSKTTGAQALAATSTGINDGNYHHLALTRDGTTMRLYVDGVHVANANDTFNAPAANRGIVLGILGADHSTGPYNGRMDCFRITKGVARWTGTGSFTPPTTEDDYLQATSEPFPHYIRRSLHGGLYLPRGL